MAVGCDADASVASAASMRDNEVQDYNQLTVTVKPYFKGSLLRWLSVNYDANYGFSQLKIGAESNSVNSFNQKLYATIIPGDRWQFTVGAEHFLTHFSESDTDNLILLDASATCQLSSRIRLSLTADNLLNHRHYQYVTYGTLSRTDHTFRIRPRNILASLQYRF